jgi:YHS domain-containing protein
MGAFLEYLLDVIFLLAMLRVAYSALRRLLAPRPGARESARSPWTSGARARVEMARDPECGMFVSTELSRRLQWKGQVLHFCSQDCLQKYQARSRAS